MEEEKCHMCGTQTEYKCEACEEPVCERCTVDFTYKIKLIIHYAIIAIQHVRKLILIRLMNHHIKHLNIEKKKLYY